MIHRSSRLPSGAPRLSSTREAEERAEKIADLHLSENMSARFQGEPVDFAARMMLHQIGIGIPTKDRWDDLFVTLEKLEEFGLGNNETIVMDDASREPAPQSLRDRFPRVRFERSEHSRSVTGQRNLLARLLKAPYFLQVDNDSFPVLGDLSEAAAWLEARGDAFALAFIVAEREQYAAELEALPREPFPCHYFVGCGALIKRELFLEWGGYQEVLEYFCEEVELALQAQSRGLLIYQYPGVVIQHNRSPLSRDESYRQFLVIRNELLIAALHYPFVFFLLRWPLFTLKAWIFRWVPGPAIARGMEAACRLLPVFWPLRRALTIRSFLAWKSLPKPVKYLAPGAQA